MKTLNIETVIAGEHYRVPANDGNRVYNVRYAGSGDADMEEVADD